MAVYLTFRSEADYPLSAHALGNGIRCSAPQDRSYGRAAQANHCPRRPEHLRQERTVGKSRDFH